jgi:AcrR family transcriptional regulator
LRDRPPCVGGDTGEYVNTGQYVNTLEYSGTDWYSQHVQERLSRPERKSQTRERLIDAAAAVFAERGFETATIDEVAAAAGYTKGAVYSNFASKTDLFIALIERRIEVQTAEHARRFEGQDLEGAVQRLEDEPDREPEAERQWLLLAVEFWLHAMRDERARVLMAEQYERARQASARLIAPFYELAGERPSLEPRDMAIVIESIGIGLAFQAALQPEAVRMSLQGEVISKLLNARPATETRPVSPAPSSVPEGTGPAAG